jgi:hypothetical protein
MHEAGSDNATAVIGVPGTGRALASHLRAWARLVALDRRWPLLLPLLAYAALRLWLLDATKVNSDEPQHLHIVWAWAQRALVPYRDVFDNHVPLFHMLLAPWLRWLGETADVLVWARVLMLPLAVGSVAISAWLGWRLWGRTVARGAVLLLAAVSSYALVAGEFRTDALWGAAWVAGVAVLATGTLAPRRMLVAGLLFGVALMTSLKTLPLLAALAGAASVVGWEWPRALRPSRQALLRAVLACVAGMALPVLLVLWRVDVRGALPAMIDDAWRFNLAPGLSQPGQWLRLALLPLVVTYATLSLRGRVAASPEPAPEGRRVFVQAVAWFSFAVMIGAWPLLTRQDLLPLWPLLAPVLVAWWCARQRGRWLRFAVVGGLAMALSWTLATHLPWRSRTAEYDDWLATVLAITHPGEPVMDAKGAAVFRPRPYHPVLETITLARMREGLLPDHEAAALRESQTHVVSIERFSTRALAFVRANYVILRPDLWVAGREFVVVHGARARSFALALGGDYALLDSRGHVVTAALLDGLYMGTGVALFPGEHSLEIPAAGRYRLLWRPAADWCQHHPGQCHA